MKKDRDLTSPTQSFVGGIIKKMILLKLLEKCFEIDS